MEGGASLTNGGGNDAEHSAAAKPLKRKANYTSDSESSDDVPLKERAGAKAMDSKRKPKTKVMGVGANGASKKVKREESSDEEFSSTVSDEASGDSASPSESDSEGYSDANSDAPLTRKATVLKSRTTGNGKAGAEKDVATKAVTKRKREDEDTPSSKVKGEPSRKVKTEAKSSKMAVKKIRPSGEDDDSDASDRPRAKSTPKHRNNKKVKEDPDNSAPSTPQKKGRAKKGEDDEEVDEQYKWWLENQGDTSEKWKTLEHCGVVFPPPYKPIGVRMKYDGKEITLDPESEEVAGFYAQLIGTEWVENPIFRKNFFEDWMAVLAKSNKVRDAVTHLRIPITEYYARQREERKNMTKEQKEAAKAEKKALEDKFGWATIDGRKEKIGNFRIEPPGLFRGRGAHPKAGRLKKRVMAEQVIINIGADAKVPEPPAGHHWGDVVHDNTVTWLAYWKENVNDAFKYVFFAAGSSLKGQSDLKKFEKARDLKKHVHRIRKDYQAGLKDELMATRQRSTAMYFIDRLALRAGNEKGEDEADTVGCCSLRFEHVTLAPPNKVIFDFLGKDSIRYYNEVEVEEQVFKNLKIFKKPPKKEGDPLFDRLDTSILNRHLQGYQKSLTAKVFRTYNASFTFQEELRKTPKDGTVAEKLLAYNRANREVAILCNHQRTIPKAHGNQMEKLKYKVRALKYELRKIREQILDLDPKKKKKSQYTEEESDLDEDWITQHEKNLEEQEKEKLAKKLDRENEKRREQGEKPLTMKDMEPPMKKTPSLERLEEMFEKMKEKISAQKLAMVDKDENKTTALGTSKINYIDPRISVMWCKKYDVPLEKVFNKSLLSKFKWAMETPPLFRQIRMSAVCDPCTKCAQFGNHQMEVIGEVMPVATPQMEAENPQPKPPRQTFGVAPPVLHNRKTGARYTTGTILGEGGFARCYEVVDSMRKHYAAKVVAKCSLKSPKQKQKLQGEITVHRALMHRNIVHFYDAFEDDENIYMILELCENRTFIDLLRQRRRLTEPEIRFYMYQLLTAVHYMQTRHVIHRDLKLGNLFLSKDMNLKIGDFGLAAVLNHDGERKKYTLVIGRPPFQTKDKDVKSIYKKIRDNVYEFPVNHPISMEAQNLISNLLHTRPECRPNIEDILADPFFTTPPFLSYIPTTALVSAPGSQPIPLELARSGEKSPALNRELPSTQIPVTTRRTPLTNVNGPNGGVALCKSSPTRIVGTQKSPHPREIRSHIAEIVPTKTTYPSSSLREPRGTESATHSPSGVVASSTTIRVFGRTRRDMPEPTQISRKPNPTLEKISLSPPSTVPSSPPNPSPVPPPSAILHPRLPADVDSPRSPTALAIMCRNLVIAIEDDTRSKLATTESPEINDELFVSKWIDYSHKYGLGYQLTNGCVGVYFNDASSLVVSPDNKYFEYLYKTPGRNEMNRSRARMDNFPEVLQKKVTLLQHFRQYIKDNLSKHMPSYCFSDTEVVNMDFVTKHVRSQQAVVFRLSNKIVQLNFFDHTKVILSEEGKAVTFIGSDRRPICRSFGLGGNMKPRIVDFSETAAVQPAPRGVPNPTEKARRRNGVHTTSSIHSEAANTGVKADAPLLPFRSRLRDAPGGPFPSLRRTLRSQPIPPSHAQPLPVPPEPQKKLKFALDSKRPTEDPDFDSKTFLGKRKRQEERDHGGAGYESGHNSETDNGERRKLRPRRTPTEKTRSREREILFQLIRPECLLYVENDEVSVRGCTAILLPPAVAGGQSLPVPVPLPPPKHPDNVANIPMFRVLEFPDMYVGRGKRNFSVALNGDEEDTSDEAYELRHRRYEREEKRLKNREVEVYRYELHKRREAEEARRQQEISRKLVAGGRPWGGGGGIVGTSSVTLADDDEGRVKPPKRPGSAELVLASSSVENTTSQVSTTGIPLVSRRVTDSRARDDRDFVGRNTRSGAKYRAGRTL
ncbi:DNA topoisomerase 1 [Gonapodya sp. JEL0774]|nr:DNA topoisomerase 1 [Gonapodya sp. JEL0774]